MTTKIIKNGATSFDVKCKRCDCSFIVDNITLRDGVRCPNCGIDESKLDVTKKETLLDLMVWYCNWNHGSGEYSGKKTNS